VGSVQDAITGAPVTAVARFFELVMLTAATIAGVAFVLHVAARFGAPDLTISPNAAPALAELPVRIAFSAASSAAFALACYAERRASAAAAIGGAAGVTGFLIRTGVGSQRHRRLVRRRSAGRASRPADGTTQSHPSVDGVDIGHHPVAAGPVPTSRCIRNPQRPLAVPDADANECRALPAPGLRLKLSDRCLPRRRRCDEQPAGSRWILRRS
jgi:hypothetical protein